MSLTITLSGPRVSEQQARNTLAAERFAVHAEASDHDMTPHPSGEDVREAQSFVSVEGEDIDKAASAVRPLGWALRMHYETPEAAPLSLEQQVADRLAEYEQRIAELEAKVSA